MQVVLNKQKLIPMKINETTVIIGKGDNPEVFNKLTTSHQ